MTKKQTPFFATASDLNSVMNAVSSQRPLAFMAAGLFDEEPGTVFNDFENHKSLHTYLVFDRNQNVVVRRVPQRNGPDRYAIDQYENPHTVSLQCGGLIEKRMLLIAGQLGTVAIGPASDEIFSVLDKTIREQFKRIGSYFVGPEAALLLDKGIRLAPTENSPPMYDLIR
ncbi:MAG: hypothetical protein R3C14_10380 [Caldilineaceae bacterium]